MASAWVAVLGTLLGVTVSFVLQRLNAARAESSARSESIRTSRIDAYSAFAEKVMEWRRTQIIRRMLDVGPESGHPPQDGERVRDENRRDRAAAWTAFYRVKLLCDDAGLEHLARGVLDATREMKKAESRSELNTAGDRVRELLGNFLDAAAAQTVRTSA